MNGEQQDEESVGGQRRAEALRGLCELNPQHALNVRSLCVSMHGMQQSWKFHTLCLKKKKCLDYPVQCKTFSLKFKETSLFSTHYSCTPFKSLTYIWLLDLCTLEVSVCIQIVKQVPNLNHLIG